MRPVQDVRDEAGGPDDKADNESGEPPDSGGVVVSLDLARVVTPQKPKPPAKKPPRPTIAEQLAAQKKRAKIEAEAARKAAKKARPGKGSSTRDALFKGFAQSLERASKQGPSFADVGFADGSESPLGDPDEGDPKSK